MFNFEIVLFKLISLRNLTLFIALFLGLFSFNILAQTSYSKKANNLFSEGTYWYQRQQMDKAKESFLLTLKKEKKYFEAYNGLALIAEYYHNYATANTYYLKALEINPKLKVNYYKVARNYHVIEQYDKAKTTLEEFFKRQKHQSKTFKKAKVLEQSIHLALSFQKKHFTNKVLLSDSVNTLNDEYLPTITIDASELIFTKAYRNSLNQMTEDFFYTQKKEDGTFKTAIFLDGPFNTSLNEGAICMTADGKTIYYTACGRADSYGSCDIYKSDFVNNRWTAPVNLGPEVNGKSWESQPSISPDGKRLYFVSNRDGGFGHRDIWFSEKDKNGHWSYPSNCGSNINTSADEMSPFIHWDNTHFYFASKGHAGIGGYDLFLSEHQPENKRFTKPKNLQFPINTPLDDNGLVIEQNGKSAYYISEQIRDSILNHDIYSVELVPEFRSDKTNYLFAHVVDHISGKPIDAQIEIKRLSDLHTVYKEPTAYGRFFVCLDSDEDYAVFIEKNGYLYFSEHLEQPKEESKKWEETFRLNPLEVGSIVQLKNMFFKFDSDELIETSKPEISRIVTLLKQNKALKVAIIGHTDDLGKETYNLNLSKNRANTIKLALTKQGIPANRVTTIGKGEEAPLVPNTSEENRAQNRRTELKILEL